MQGTENIEKRTKNKNKKSANKKNIDMNRYI